MNHYTSRAGSQRRTLAHFAENLGRVVAIDELAYVAKDAKEYARRVRELRPERSNRSARG